MFVIAIDGPAGSGKSTTARGVAAALSFSHLDTGAMYRALTYLAFSSQVDPTDGSALADLARSLEFNFIDPPAAESESKKRLLVNGNDITEEIRGPIVSATVSKISAHVEVREALVEKQRLFAEGVNGVVAEGRDIGTVVFPNADLKVYLDASLEARAQRRTDELLSNGVETNLKEQMSQIQQRDDMDSGREASPLRAADDSVRVDTTGMSIDEQIEHVAQLARERITV